MHRSVLTYINLPVLEILQFSKVLPLPQQYPDIQVTWPCNESEQPQQILEMLKNTLMMC